ncbi:MAG: hypothetical protein A07HN63_02189, partial [uncultured archaeon A07HN63]
MLRAQGSSCGIVFKIAAATATKESIRSISESSAL